MYDGSSNKIKKSVIPHIFDCQPYRIKTSNTLSRPAYNKLNRKREIAEILSDTETQKENNFLSASSQQPPHKMRKNKTDQIFNATDKTIFLDLTNSVSFIHLIYKN